MSFEISGIYLWRICSIFLIIPSFLHSPNKTSFVRTEKWSNQVLVHSRIISSYRELGAFTFITMNLLHLGGETQIFPFQNRH